MYLSNDKFVHATVRSGVIISDLKEAYYQRYFAGAGRF
jgi:lipoprotein Spr